MIATMQLNKVQNLINIFEETEIIEITSELIATYYQNVVLAPSKTVIPAPIVFLAAAPDFAVCCRVQLVVQFLQALNSMMVLVVEPTRYFLPGNLFYTR